jgi:hypothetical protein
MHGQRRGHVAGDLFEHALLSIRERVTMTREESSNEGGSGRDGFSGRDVEIENVKGMSNTLGRRFDALAAKRQQQLQSQKLVES